MYLATLDEIKQLLGITDTAKDAQITALIPIIHEFIIAHTNNYFTDAGISFAGMDITFASGSPATITTGTGSFVDAGFLAGMVIYVEGSMFNDGYYLVAEVTDTTLTLAEGEVLAGENPSTIYSTTIYRAQIPTAIRLAAARMVDVDLKGKADVAAEKVGNYSVNYAIGGRSVGYPQNVISLLNVYKKLKFGE